jgi:hypothetical protein
MQELFLHNVIYKVRCVLSEVSDFHDIDLENFFSSRKLQCVASNLPYLNISYDLPTLGDEGAVFLGNVKLC